MFDDLLQQREVELPIDVSVEINGKDCCYCLLGIIFVGIPYLWFGLGVIHAVFGFGIAFVSFCIFVGTVGYLEERAFIRSFWCQGRCKKPIKLRIFDQYPVSKCDRCGKIHYINWV